MRTGLSKVLAGVVALFAVAGTCHAGRMATSGSIEQTQTIRNTNASLTSTKKLYWKGDNVRIEEYSIGGLNVQIKKGREVYQYVPARKAAVKIVLPGSKGLTVEQLFANDAKVPQGTKKIGSALVAGIMCNIYAPSEKGRNARVYMSTDPRFPLALKTEITSGTAKETMETVSIKLGTSISDSLFTLPKGTKVTLQKITPLRPFRGGGERRHKKSRG